MQKKEYETSLYGSTFVAKTHPLIVFRGALDSFGAQIVWVQTQLETLGGQESLIAHLQEILDMTGEIMGAEVLQKPLEKDSLIGRSFDRLREESHNPQKYFAQKALAPPHKDKGPVYALLNVLRATAREVEIKGVRAFLQGEALAREDICKALNRLSSALYVLMCESQG